MAVCLNYPATFSSGRNLKMSAESPRRSSSQTRAGGPNNVAPQQVTDPTILDSVAGFINEVVPTAYNIPSENDDKIQWAHFEQLDSEEIQYGAGVDTESFVPPSLILVLGYTTGIQIWAIPASGEATEILSWRHSTIRVLRLIPTPSKAGSNDVDYFSSARPLIALCDSSANYSYLTFRSLRSGILDPIKQIQFKTPILNVLANRHSVIVTFAEKIAVFDAFTLENRLSITTCYLSPGIQQNPVALGPRWLAYAEKKLVLTNQSGGGSDGEGVQSYTATVLHAAKSLGRGIREFTESVAGSLAGIQNFKPGSPQAGGPSDMPQKGIVTILDIENSNINSQENIIPQDAVIAHFVAHTEAIVCLTFDPSGTLLLTSDKRGHDFHVFRIHPHPMASALAGVHHLYVLHRGDTSAKVQDMCFSPDSRWVTVSTLRGTTHVFPVTPYGGNISVRTHATAHVVNKMSRYQRSAGLTSDGRSSSPVSTAEPVNYLFPYRNPRYAPYPQPTVIHPLAQIRQPVYVQNVTSLPQRTPGRQRLSSSSEENITLRVVACFASPRAWMDAVKGPRESTLKPHIKPVESLFVMSCYGTLIQYDLEPHSAPSVPKDRICNDTSIELKVYPKAQWSLHRRLHTIDVPLPMSEENLAFITQSGPLKKMKSDPNDEQWLSQVEIVTHLGPHRRLWMGPQFTFKTYTITNGAVLDVRAVDVQRSKPINMPVSKATAILIESGSASSCEQLFLDTYHKACDEVGSVGELRLKEDLADAMLESPGIRDAGGHCVIVSMKPNATVTKVVNPLGTVITIQSDEENAEIDVEEDAVIHENCDEALFRPVMAPRAMYYAGMKPQTCLSEHIITKSLESNTEVAVKIINKKSKEKIVEKNNKAKHVKSRDSSPKVNSEVERKLQIKTDSKTKTKEKITVRKAEPVPELNDILSSLSCELLPPLNVEELRPESPLFETILRFEDAADCSENLTICNKPEEIICSSEEEKVLRKARKPKTKLGVKITKEKENLLDNDIHPKISWNIVAGSKPKDKLLDLEEDYVENFTMRLSAKKDTLVDIDENIPPKKDDFNLIKLDKSSDEAGSSPADMTESDDSSKIPPIIDLEDDAVPVQAPQSAVKGPRKKSKKKKK